MTPVISTDRLARFFSRVTVTASGCWRFATLNGKGYGAYYSFGAHRVAYEWFVGPIPEGLHIDHLCFNKACVNPAHLEPVTLTENNRRGHPWVRLGQCLNGHAITPGNIYTWKTHGQTFRGCRACRMASRQRWINRRHGARPMPHVLHLPKAS